MNRTQAQPSVARRAIIYSYDDLQIGQAFEEQVVIGRQDVLAFADATGDHNPIHLDEAYAAQTVFERPIVHGMLTASQISRILASSFPGPGTIYLNQTLKFTRPVFHGDELTITLEVVSKNRDKGIVTLGTTIKNQEEVVVLVGEAHVLPPSP